MDKETGEEESGELDQVELTWIFCCVWVCSLICQIYEVVVFVLCFCVFVLCLYFNVLRVQSKTFCCIHTDD